MKALTHVGDALVVIVTGVLATVVLVGGMVFDVVRLVTPRRAR